MSTAAASPQTLPVARGGLVLPEWILRLRKYRGYIVPISFVAMMVVLLVPVPPLVMDVFIALNIALSIIIAQSGGKKSNKAAMGVITLVVGLVVLVAGG